MRSAINEALCSGHGRCYVLAPEVYTADDEGFVVQRGTEFDVPAELEEKARIGLEACPEGCISIVG